MPDHRSWLSVALESYEAGKAAADLGLDRSALSRFYYAAYQAATAGLLYRGVTPPTLLAEDGSLREAWSHSETPELFVVQMEPLIPSKDQRQRVRNHLAALYRKRIRADYLMEQPVE